jgi:hypothetical protein
MEEVDVQKAPGVVSVLNMDSISIHVLLKLHVMLIMWHAQRKEPRKQILLPKLEPFNSLLVWQLPSSLLLKFEQRK